MTALEYARLIINLLMLATGIGLVFVALASPRRTATNYYFAIFAAVLSSFALVLVLRVLTGSIPTLSAHFGLRFISLLLVLLISAYFTFVVYFLSSYKHWVKWLTVALWGLAFAGSTVILFVNIFAEISADGTRFRLNWIGITLVSLAILYSISTVVIVWRSPKGQSRWLRIPSVCIALGYVMTALAPDLPLDVLLFTMGALWAASALMRQQIFVPMQMLNRELEGKNEDLQETIKQLQKEKNQVDQLNRELVDANRYKAEFFANISHELRTPLNAIIGYSELLTSPVYGTLNTQQIDRIQRIHRNGKHLSSLIDNILDLGQIDAGKLTLEKHYFSVESVIDSVIAKAKPLCEVKSLQFASEVEPNLPNLFGDVRRIEQVLYNLVENAIKFTHSGSVALSVLPISVDNGVSGNFDIPSGIFLPDGAWVLFQVRDTGIGIAQEDMRQIFVNFVQVDGSTTREYGGIGLGLPIVKQLIELHGGMVWLESTPNQGTTFYLALPTTVKVSA